MLNLTLNSWNLDENLNKLNVKNENKDEFDVKKENDIELLKQFDLDKRYGPCYGNKNKKKNKNYSEKQLKLEKINVFVKE